MKKLVLSVVAAAALASPALAADMRVKAPPPPPPPSPWDIAFGAGLTSDYIFRGITQSNHNPSVNAFFDPRFNATPYLQYYAGIAGSSISFPNRAAAEIVACECVVLAETKDHLDWELIKKCGEHLTGRAGAALAEAAGKIEDQEDEHLYHTKGWCRELWIKSLGMTAVLPPPEEVQKVKTAIGAARAADIVAGRPYASSDELLDRGILAAGVYEQIRTLVTVR